MRTYFLFFLLAISTVSCVSVIDGDSLIVDDSKLSISALFSSDSERFEVYLSKSRPLSSNKPFQSIKDATVRLLLENTFLETLVYDQENDAYISLESTIIKGKTYNLEIFHPDYPTAYAETTIPEEAGIQSTTIRDFTGTESETRPDESVYSFTIDIEIDDPEALSNYYHILFYVERFQLSSPTGQQETEPTYTLPNFNEQKENPTEALLSDNTLESYGAFFDDADFNGRTQSFPFSLEYSINPAVERVESIWVEIRSVSKPYYDFYLTYNQQSQLSTNPLTNNLSSVESNIANGVGVFGAYTSTWRRIRL